MDQDTGPRPAKQPEAARERKKMTRAQVMADPKNRRWIKIMGFSLLAAVGGSLLIGDMLLPDCEHEGCPAVERLRTYRPPEPPQIFDAEGELAGQLQGPQRTVIALDSIPALIRDGYIAVEDQRFREHGGVDFAGGMRAFVRNFRSGGVEQGASTITMQLARNVFADEVLDYNKWHRKATELRTAKEIEDQLSKDEILELYLNMIYLGDGVWGVETAAQQYFGKPVMDVSTGEAALLIGLAKNPEGYNPRRNPERAVERRNLVLDVLVAEGLITAAEAEAAKAEEIVVTKEVGGEGTGWGTNAYYLGAVQRELREMFPNPYDRRGLRVHTGLDQRAQEAAATALVGQIRAVEEGKWGRFRHEGAPAELPRADGDSPYLQGMVVAMDVQTGLVTTLLGGRDFDHSEFDRAFMAKRQPGSSFKPIVYLTALASGLRPSEGIPTDQIVLAQRGSEDWTPDDHVSAQRLSVRDALVYSSNAASVRVGQRAGIDRVIEQAHAMGISTDLPNYPSIFLGSGEVIPAELVAAYATFGNGGHTIAPHFITRIEDGKGGLIYRREASGGVRAVDQRLGFLVLDMMRDVVRRGTGTRAAIGVPVAGKTGTTNDSKDLWFIGLTPKLVAGVWLGFDRPATVVADAGGGDLAAPIWGQFMRVATRGQGSADWAPPPGVIQATVDMRSGMLWSEGCVGGEPRTEYFLAGTEPLSQCRSFGTGWVMSPDGRWEFRGYGYGDSLGGYGSYQSVDTVEAWEVNPEQYRTRFYRDTVSPEELERRRRAQLDSMDAAQGRRRYGDTVRITPQIRPAAPLETQDQEPSDPPEPVPPTDPEPAPDPAPADTTGLG